MTEPSVEAVAPRALGGLPDPGDMLEVLRAHPRHLVLAALLAGMLVAPLAPRFILLLAGLAAVLAGRAPLAFVAAAAVVTGAFGIHARTEAVDRTRLTPFLDTDVSAQVVLLEQPHPLQYGSSMLAELRPPAPKERVMLRVGSHVTWPAVVTGSIVQVHGRLRRLGPFEQYEARRGAHAAITVDDASPTGAVRGGLWHLVDVVRGHAEAALDEGLEQPQRALLRGMVLGQDSGFSREQKGDFQDAGLSHLVAASGSNVALLAALALPLLTWVGAGLRIRLFGVLALIALYVPLAGAGPSIQRAGVMGGATIVASLAGRPASRWYALLLAAVATLALNPHAVGDVGWQLSFAAVAAIALLAPGMRRWLVRRRVPDGLASATAVTAAATIGTAPLIAAQFSELSVVSLVANILAEPAVPPIMWLGMIAGALGQVAAPLALPLNAVNSYALGYLSWVAHTAAHVPHAVVAVRLHGPVALVGVYLAIVAVVVGIRVAGARLRSGRAGESGSQADGE